VFLTVLAEDILAMVQFVDRLPGGVLGSIISHLFDKEMHRPTTHFMGQDGFNLILNFSVNDFGVWRGRGTTAEVLRRWGERPESVHMKHIMDAHRWRKLNLEGDRGALLEKGERSKKSGLKRGGGASGVVGGGNILSA